MKKKLLATLLCIAMTATMLAGCGSKTEPTTTTPTTETDTAADTAADTTAEAEAPAEESALDTSTPVTLKWYLDGSTINDDKAVMAKVNEYLTEKLNVTLEPIWGTWGDFEEGVTLAINGGDDVDIYFTCSWTPNEYTTYSQKGSYVRLDDPENNLLEKYGKDIWNALPDVLKEGAMVDGASGTGIYGIPGYKDFGTQNCWDINVTLLEKYGYTLADIESRSYYEFGDIMKTVKEGEGKDFYPLLVEGAVLERMVNNSIIVNGDAGALNVLSYYIDNQDVSNDIGSKIVNKFATEEYKKFVEKTREYYEAGYIDPGCAIKATANDLRTSKQLTASYLIGTQSYALGYEIQAMAERNIEVAFVPCTAPYVDKTSTQGAVMAVSTTSKNPERAVAFLNLLNTDPYLMTLLQYGIEGTHYNLDADGLVEFTEERANYTPWRNGMGNITILPPQAGEGKDFFKSTFIPYYESGKAIPAFGYRFDATSVETELASLANTGQEYALALSTGAVDPATALPEFLKKLESGGINTVVDEANVQLAAYFAAQ